MTPQIIKERASKRRRKHSAASLPFLSSWNKSLHLGKRLRVTTEFWWGCHCRWKKNKNKNTPKWTVAKVLQTVPCPSGAAPCLPMATRDIVRRAHSHQAAASALASWAPAALWPASPPWGHGSARGPGESIRLRSPGCLQGVAAYSSLLSEETFLL